jgi:ribonuclease R
MGKRNKKDPHWQRESEKYEHPVPSREYILNYLRGCESLQSFKQFLAAFELVSDEEKEGLRRRLRAMERDSQIIANRRGSYGLIDELELIPGRVQSHHDGFGFLIPDDGGSDIFLSARHMRELFNDDRALVRVISKEKRRNRREGALVEVLERNTFQVVGRYIEEDGVAFVDPDNKKIHQDVIITEENKGCAKPGQFVVAEIISQPSTRRQPLGKVIDILGDQLTPGMEVELAIRSRDIPYTWPSEVMTQAQNIPNSISNSIIENRSDCRHLYFVTIDGEDAKDFDDAVYCEAQSGGGWRLWVAIADVTHYVKASGVLDQEALKRGNSVYFPSKVIPMLPEQLSNGLCSLKPNVDRLTMVCEMDIDGKGRLKDYQFYEATIHSHARLTYTQVSDILKSDGDQDAELYPHINQLNTLYKKLMRQRNKRGAIEFETIETQILFGQEGKIDKIVPRQRNVAHKIIEECMLLANVSAADFLDKSGIEALYRNHESPEEQKLFDLKDFLKSFGLRLGGGTSPTAHDYCSLLNRIEKRADKHLIQTVLLRSLRQAVYAEENRGHFGLSYTHYTHFTSPIRRYPDMIVHRAIKYLLKNKNPKKFFYDAKTTAELGIHCSFTERRADYATRDAVDWLKSEYMQDKVGQAFDGIITDVTSFGVFVELCDIYVQGLVHITSLKNDYYHYDASHHSLRGKRSGKTYRLGDPMRVLVARVDLDRREINFEVV